MIPISGLTTSGVIPLSSVTVRTFASSTVNAFYEGTRGAVSTVAELMPVHPASQRQIANLPEAYRELETIACYPPAASALRRASGSTPPQVDYQGRTYTVTARENYDEQGGASIVFASLVEAVTA
jgi:hypothetical protein